MNLFLPYGYTRNLKPQYCGRPETSIKFQDETYKLSHELSLDSSCVVDIGAGDGIKLNKYFSDRKVTAADYGPNIELCRQQGLETIEINLENQQLYSSFKWQPKSAILCIDVIEHLVNVDNLLTGFQQILSFCHFILLATPERDLIYGRNRNNGPPANPCHAQEWTMMEMSNLLKSYDLPFTAGLIGDTEKCTNMYFIISQ